MSPVETEPKMGSGRAFRIEPTFVDVLSPATGLCKGVSLRFLFFVSSCDSF